MNLQKLDDFQTLTQYVAEANTLSKKSHLNKQEERRYDFLLAGISLLKSGAASATELRRRGLNDKLAAAGGRRVVFGPDRITPERKQLLDAYRQIARGVEARFLEAGNGSITSTASTSGGTFVPIEYFNGPFQTAVATVDPLVNPDVVSFIETDSGATLTFPLTNDTDNDAAVIGENTKGSAVDPGAITQTQNNVFTYRTPKMLTSIEFDQDALAEYNVGLLERFFAERIARGVGKDLLLGDGSGKPLGLILSLSAVGVVPITASGSSADDGVSGNTGANSIGSQDLRNLFFSVQERYRNSFKAAWLMNDTTLNAIASLRDKMGHPIFPMDLDKPTLYGKPVRVSPSMDNIGASQVPIVFGDLSHWLTRHAGGQDYVRNYRELPGVVEYGLTAWSCFSRWGGQLLSSNGSRPAINYIMNHT